MLFSRGFETGVVLSLCFIAACFYGEGARAETGTVLSYQKISDTQGSFTGVVDSYDYLGCSTAAIGDLNNDANSDIVVGAYRDDDGGTDRGAVWIMFLNSNGTVKGYQKISNTVGDFAGFLDDGDNFGFAVTSVDDIDGDYVDDIVVGAPGDDDGGTDRGAVWILFMNANGTVKSHRKISDTDGNFSGILDNDDNFGSSVAGLGDMDGDHIPDIAVGAINDDDGGTNKGAVWILFLNSNGTVKSHQKISDTGGGFTGILASYDLFGTSVSAGGDIDGDNVTDIIVGASKDNDGGTDRGAAWVLFMNTNGTVRTHQKISGTSGDFSGTLDDSDLFGSSVCSLGDLDRDEVTDIAVGAINDDDGGANRGAVWILFLKSNGKVKSHRKISSTDGNFPGALDNSDNFGSGLCALKDLNKDRITDLVAGAIWDDDGSTNTGAVWVLFLDACNYNLAGDANFDCRLDFDDFALMANDWLIDCKQTPADPNCIPTRQ